MKWMCNIRLSRIWGLLAALALALTSSSGGPRAQGLTRVDLELVLAVDTSGSVNSDEFELQIEGLVQAFRDPAVIAAIISTSASGGVAAAGIQPGLQNLCLEANAGAQDEEIPH